MRRVLNHKSERRWRASVRLGKRSKQFGVGKETREGKRRCRQRKADRERPALAPHLCALHVISAIASKCSEGGRDYLLLKLADPLQRFDSANLFDEADGAGSLLMGCGSENRLRIAPKCPVRIERAGLREDGQSHPRGAANRDRAETGEDLTPYQ